MANGKDSVQIGNKKIQTHSTSTDIWSSLFPLHNCRFSSLTHTQQQILLPTNSPQVLQTGADFSQMKIMDVFSVCPRYVNDHLRFVLTSLSHPAHCARWAPVQPSGKLASVLFHVYATGKKKIVSDLPNKRAFI
ncbi:hypothetical protein CHARACLAT_020209 [Characodon lateralis]|uniref:Uncharacterized protein n=1 Tax=Characodon lateralis TaxID=208331 RepID=A0ABU7DBJ1_9TELE|nr:hypothetical protein [Characodon lateralis]